ncbi:hypothetical protein GC173_15475 [bacterium]|nr:hypothetical protein [bacterium]
MTDQPVDMERLNLITGGDEEMIQELVDLFVSDTTARIASMVESVARQDRLTLKRQAHAVKGASANMGATHLFNICMQLEKSSETGNVDELSQLLSAAQSAMAEATAFFAKR